MISRPILRDLSAALLLCTLAVFVADRLAPAGSATTPDSLAYLEAARHIADGHGITLATNPFSGAEEYRPMTAWPPLYPVLLSTVIPTEPAAGPQRAAMLASLLLIATVLACYLLFRRQWPAIGATVAAAAVCVSAPAVSVYAYAWSETLFLPLLCIALLLATIAADSNDAKRAGAAFAGLAVVLALAFATRYAGWVLALLLPVAFLLNRSRLHLAAVAGALALYAAIAGAVIARNHVLTGSFSGSGRQAGAAPGEVLDDIASTLALHVTPTLLLLVALLLAALTAFTLHRRPPASPAAGRPWLAPALAAGTALTSLLALIAMATIARFDSIDQRLLSPVLLPLLIAVLAALPLAATRRSPAMLAGCAVLAALLVTPGIFKLASVASHWRELGAPMIARDRHSTFANYTSASGKPLLQDARRAIAPLAAVVYSDRPRLASVLTGLPARNLPPGPLDAERLQLLAARSDGILLLMHRGSEFITYSQGAGIAVRYHPELAQRGILMLPLDQPFTQQFSSIPAPQTGTP